MTADRPIHVYIDSSFDVEIGEVWPDGDAPETPTAADVIEVMKRSGSIRSLLRDWNMEPDEINVVIAGDRGRWCCT